MISIIICSREKEISLKLRENIENTIQSNYELIIIDNSQNKYSVFEAYNLGIAQSKGKYLCFLHDDIFFHTKGWGGILNSIFKSNSKIGLIGIAGTLIKTKMPSAWWDCDEAHKRVNIIQHFSNQTQAHWKKGFKDDTLVDVVAIDGVFMAAQKNEAISFSTVLNGFHNYDLNLSFEYLKHGYRVVVTKDILLEHYSFGVLNESWYSSSLLLHKLYKDFLPLNFSNSKNLNALEFSNGKKFLDNLSDLNLSKEVFHVWKQLIYLKPFNKIHFYFFKKILKKCLQL